MKTRTQGNRRLTFLLCLILAVSLGCSSIGGLSAATSIPATPSPTPELAIHLSSTPPAPPVLPPPPAPASIAKGKPEEQATALADQIATDESSGDDQALLADWLSVYDALGVPVIGEDGKALGSTGDDPIGPYYWQVWYVSGLDLPGRAITLSDAAHLMASSFQISDATGFTQDFFQDLQAGAQSQDPQVQLMGLFVRERVLRGPSHVDITDSAATPDVALIDPATVQLLSWIVLRAALFQAMSQSKASLEPSLVAYHPGSVPASRGQLDNIDCSSMTSTKNALANWIVGQLTGGFQYPGMEEAFHSLAGRIAGLVFSSKGAAVSEAAATMADTVIGFANLISSDIGLIMELESMKIKATETPDPLVRTTDTSPGNQGTIKLQLYYDIGSLPHGAQLASCVSSALFSAFGVSLGFPMNGPVAGADLQLEEGQGFRENIVLWNGFFQHKITDSNGMVAVDVIGGPQKKQLPDNLPPVKKKFSVLVSAQPEGLTPNSFISLSLGALLTAAVPNPVSALSTVASVLKLMHYNMGEYFFNLQDWSTVQPYDAKGELPNGTVFFGVICDLSQPFSVQATLPSYFTYTMQFTPSSENSGKMTMSGNWPGAGPITGDGSYTVQGLETQTPKIILQVTGTTHTSVVNATGSGEIDLELTPLQTGDCSQ